MKKVNNNILQTTTATKLRQRRRSNTKDNKNRKLNNNNRRKLESKKKKMEIVDMKKKKKKKQYDDKNNLMKESSLQFPSSVKYLIDSDAPLNSDSMQGMENETDAFVSNTGSSNRVEDDDNMNSNLVDKMININNIKLNRYVKTAQCCGKCCCFIPTPCCTRYIKDIFKVLDLSIKLFIGIFNATNGFYAKSLGGTTIALIVLRMMFIGLIFLDTFIKLIAYIVEHALTYFKQTTLPLSDKKWPLSLRILRPLVLIASLILLLYPILHASEIEPALVEETKLLWGTNALLPYAISEKVNLFLWSCFGQLIMITVQQLNQPDLTLVYKTIDPTMEKRSFPSMSFDKNSIRYVEYDPELKLDVYLPSTDILRGNHHHGGLPVVIFFHGGGWVYRTRKDYPVALVEFIRSRGIAFISVEYRLLQHGWNGTDILSDVRDVFKYLHINGAHKIGIDMNRSVVMGNSAGGHLAYMAGYKLAWFDEEEKLIATGKNNTYLKFNSNGVKGIIDLCGMVPTEHDVDNNKLDDSSTYYRFTMNKDSMKQFYDPVNHINKNSPPTMIIHGTADMSVSIDRSKRVMEALKNYSIPSQLIAVPGEIHACEQEPFGSCHQYGAYAMQYFLYDKFKIVV